MSKHFFDYDDDDFAMSISDSIRPIQEALKLNYQRQFLRAERDIERAKAEKRLAELNRQNKKEESA